MLQDEPHISLDALPKMGEAITMAAISLGIGLSRSAISPQDAIKRRFNRVLARFTIWSIPLEPGPALGLGLLRVGPLERN